MSLQLVDVLCQRWGQPPSAILGEDAHYLFRLLAVVGAGEEGDGDDHPEMDLAGFSTPLEG